MIQCNLEALGKLLDSLKIAWKLEAATKNNPLEHLIIDMGEDAGKRPLLLHLSLFEKAASQKGGKKSKFLNIVYLFPFGFNAIAVGQLARYLLFINKSVEFPGFGLSENDRRIYYRYDLFCPSDKIDSKVLEGLIGYILFLIDSFGPKIENTATSKTLPSLDFGS